MGYRITYQGDDHTHLGDYLTAVLKTSGEGNWMVEVVLQDPGFDGVEVVDVRLNGFDPATGAVTLGVVDEHDDYEPTGETREVQLHQIQEVTVQ